MPELYPAPIAYVDTKPNGISTSAILDFGNDKGLELAAKVLDETMALPAIAKEVRRRVDAVHGTYQPEEGEEVVDHPYVMLGQGARLTAGLIKEVASGKYADKVEPEVRAEIQDAAQHMLAPNQVPPENIQGKVGELLALSALPESLQAEVLAPPRDGPVAA